jgi:hypothetical protein
MWLWRHRLGMPQQSARATKSSPLAHLDQLITATPDCWNIKFLMYVVSPERAAFASLKVQVNFDTISDIYGLEKDARNSLCCKPHVELENAQHLLILPLLINNCHLNDHTFKRHRYSTSLIIFVVW